MAFNSFQAVMTDGLGARLHFPVLKDSGSKPAWGVDFCFMVVPSLSGWNMFIVPVE